VRPALAFTVPESLLMGLAQSVEIDRDLVQFYDYRFMTEIAYRIRGSPFASLINKFSSITLIL